MFSFQPNLWCSGGGCQSIANSLASLQTVITLMKYYYNLLSLRAYIHRIYTGLIVFNLLWMWFGEKRWLIWVYVALSFGIFPILALMAFGWFSATKKEVGYIINKLHDVLGHQFPMMYTEQVKAVIHQRSNHLSSPLTHSGSRKPR